MKRAHESHENRILLGDCVSLSKDNLSSDSVHLIITDPPFAIQGHTLDKHYNRDESNVVSGYVEVASKDYAAFSDAWVQEATRVLRPGGRMFIVSGWSHLTDILEAVRRADLTTLNHIIWKFNFGVFTTRKFVSSHYHILLVQKGPGPPCTPPADLGDVWQINREYKPGQIKNKNQLPTELLRRMIEMGSEPGDLVVDFFAGSGSTCVEAVRMGRETLGFEINPQAYPFARDNLSAALSPKRKISSPSEPPLPNLSPSVPSIPVKVLPLEDGQTPDLVISQVPSLETADAKSHCAEMLRRAARQTRKGGSLFFVVSPDDLLFVLRSLYSIKEISEVNHNIWAWTPTKKAERGRLPSAHLHVLFFEKQGGERTFNRFCRFSQTDRTVKKGSACYADMEDVWWFGEEFEEAVPRMSSALVQKIVQYCSRSDDLVVDVFITDRK